MRRIPPLILLALLLLLAQAALAAPQQALQQERRVALVIGNSGYKEQYFGPLPNPANDARDMAAALKKLGFEVIHKQDANKREMEDAIRSLGTQLKKGGVGLFYFAGHGIQYQNRNYLIPLRAGIHGQDDLAYEGVDAERVLSAMSVAENGFNIVILDACRANMNFPGASRSGGAGLAEMKAPTGSLIAYATSPGSYAADGQSKNGTYTESLLRRMATPGLPVEQMFKQVRMDVAKVTKNLQIPWEHSSLMGDFSFAGAAQTASPAASATPAAMPDLKAERQRVAEEAAQLKREKDELAQMQTLQTEKARLAEERRQLEQAKQQQLALALAQKQPPGVQLTAPVGAPNRQNGKARVALVIGNAAYPTAPLENTLNDARLIAKTLTSLGFQINLKIDAGKTEMEDAVAWLETSVKHGGVGLFYYAGHAVEVSGGHYLIPVDAKLSTEGDLKHTSMRVDQVLRMETSAATGSRKSLGRVVAYAGGPGLPVFDTLFHKPGTNSPYTASLAEELLRPGVEIHEALRLVRERVRRDTSGKQIPETLSSAQGKIVLSSTTPLPDGQLGILILDSDRNNPFQKHKP